MRIATRYKLQEGDTRVMRFATYEDGKHSPYAEAESKGEKIDGLPITSFSFNGKRTYFIWQGNPNVVCEILTQWERAESMGENWQFVYRDGAFLAEIVPVASDETT